MKTKDVFDMMTFFGYIFLIAAPICGIIYTVFAYGFEPILVATLGIGIGLCIIAAIVDMFSKLGKRYKVYPFNDI